MATFSVPASVTVPELVIGPPDVVKPVMPPDTSTLVTVPAPGVLHVVLVPSVDNTLPLLPDCEGSRAFRAALAVVWPVPPLAIGSVPVTPVDRGKPVKLVAVPEDGVPNAPPLVKYEPAGCLLLNVVQSVDVR